MRNQQELEEDRENDEQSATLPPRNEQDNTVGERDSLQATSNNSEENIKPVRGEPTIQFDIVKPPRRNLPSKGISKNLYVNHPKERVSQFPGVSSKRLRRNKEYTPLRLRQHLLSKRRQIKKTSRKNFSLTPRGQTINFQPFGNEGLTTSFILRKQFTEDASRGGTVTDSTTSNTPAPFNPENPNEVNKTLASAPHPLSNTFDEDGDLGTLDTSMTDNEDYSLHFDESAFESPIADRPLSRTMTTNYLSWEPTLGRNSTFYGLTKKQKEELGGVEYLSLIHI